jgi:hypothetical protein
MRWVVRAGRLGVAGAVLAAGVVLVGTGLLIGLTAAPVSAAATVGCDGWSVSTSLVPGDSGSCTFSYTETAAKLGNPFTVTVSVTTSSHSGGGAAGTGTATEALLDGQSTGVQVSVTDSAGKRFGLGRLTCSGSYPDASSCSSGDPNQAVPGATGTSSWTGTFTIAWRLPITAGNPYQGGSAVVTVTPFYNGIPAPTPSPTTTPAPTPTGGVAGASTTAAPSGGGSPESTPPTGAGPIPLGSLILLALGMALLLAGVTGVAIATRGSGKPGVP